MDEQHFTFGAFELFPKRRLLLESGVPVRLGPRAFDLLAVLAERSGKIVSNSELLQLVWPHAKVDDVALRVHLSSLRKALLAGNGGRSPISNVSGRGYTLTIPISEASVDNAREPGEGLAGFDSPTVNLPSAGKPLIGREKIVGVLRERLRNVGLLSIVGPGGIGKTSVALSIAELANVDYPGGVGFVDLAAITDPGLLWTAIAAAAQIATYTELVSKAVIAALKGRRYLMVLDNCEHMVEAAAAVAYTLRSEVPTLDILATSREPLRIATEHVHRLSPLECPSHGAELSLDRVTDFSALRLLVERASAQDETFVLRSDDLQMAATLCRKLDGLPLGIELVASGVATFGLRTVLAHMEDRNAILMRGTRTDAPRHQTLGAVLDWSFNLLSDTEKQVLTRLAVFQGGVDFQTAMSFLTSAEISPDDVIEAIYELHTKSLLSADLGQDEIQYRLLETTRAYSIGKLQAEGLLDELLRRHAEFICELTENAEPDWNDGGRDEWHRRYVRRIVDVRSALDWSASDTGDIRLAARILINTAPLWTELGVVAEYRERLNSVLLTLDNGAQLDEVSQIRLKLEWAKAAWVTQGPTDKTIQVAQEAFKLADKLGIPELEVAALWLLWDNRTVFGNQDESVPARALRLANTSRDPVVQLAALRLVAIDHHYQGDQQEGWSYQTRIGGYSPSIFLKTRKITHRADQSTAHLTLSARMLWLRGFPDQAMSTAREGVARAGTLNDLTLAYYLGFAGCPVALWCGDISQAELWVSELNDIARTHSLVFWQELGEVYELAVARLRQGPDELPAPGLPEGADSRFLSNQLELFASVHPDFASPMVLTTCEKLETGWGLAEALRARSLGAQFEIAEQLLHRARDVARKQGALSWELRAAISMAELLDCRGRYQDALAALEPVYDRFTEGFATRDLKTARDLIQNLRANIPSG